MENSSDAGGAPPTGPTLDVEALKRDILSGNLSRDEAIARMRLLMKRRDEFPLRVFLKEALARQPPLEIPEFLVRAFGSLQDPAAVEDLVPYLSGEDPTLVTNAVKAMADLDPAAAVAHCRPILLRPRGQLAYAVADVITERCPREAESLFLPMAFSRRSKHRALSLYFLKRLPAGEALPILLEMIRRERKSGVRRLLGKLLKARTSPEAAPVLEKFCEELLAKVGEVRGILELTRKDTDSGSGPPSLRLDPAVLEDGSSVSQRIDLASIRPGPEAPLGPPDAAERDRIVEFEKWKQKKWKESRRTEGRSVIQQLPVLVDDNRRKLAAGLIILLGLFAWSLSGPAEERAAAAVAPRASTLGNPGSSVRFGGLVQSTDPEKRALRLRTKDATEVLAFFLDRDVKGFSVGSAVEIQGILRRVDGPRSVVVQGHSARLVEEHDLK